MTAVYEWRGLFTNQEINALHAEAFNTRLFSETEWNWVQLVRQHSLGWVVARQGEQLAGFVNVVVAPGHTEAEARKVAREICALPAEAVAISRKLLKLPPEDMTRRIDQEGHLFGERMRSKEAVAAFKAFFARKKG